MKCPHCGQEHPDSFRFCPMTGQSIAPQFKACSNEQCRDFGKYILPLVSKFCPSCGKPLDAQTNEIPNATSANNAQSRTDDPQDSTDTDDMLTFSVGGVHFNMMLVEHGEFWMGSSIEDEKAEEFEIPRHKVILTEDYYIGETPVTQDLWMAIMVSNPSYYKGGDRPVESVSWNDCQKFITELNRRLSSELAATGMKFRLPTEAEWEFAARGGNYSVDCEYAGSDDPCDVAWFSDNDDLCETHRVAQLESNELGLYDMCGNVEEWCQDRFCFYSHKTQTNPIGAGHDMRRVVRGGCYFNEAQDCRVSSRFWYDPTETEDSVGFRLVLSK